MPGEYYRLFQYFQRFGKFYARQFAPMMAREGLSLQEVWVLLFLANNPGYDTAREVCQRRGMSKSQVSQAVELLVGRGALRRLPDGADRRVVHLAITEAGLPLAREAQRVQSACGRQLLSDLTPEEEAQLRRLVDKIFDSGEKWIEEDLVE